MFRDLREFIERVEQLGELKIVEDVDWDLEIGAITNVVAWGQNPPALLFDKIKGYPAGFRVLSNVAVTHKRMALVLGLPWEGDGLQLVRALRDKLKEAPELVPPVEVKSGPVMENIQTSDEVDLYKFPPFRLCACVPVIGSKLLKKW